MEASAARAADREAGSCSPEPMLRFQGELMLLKARSAIRDSIGIELRTLPRLEIAPPSEKCSAKLTGDLLTVYGRDNLKEETINHETYHYAGGVTRGATAESCAKEFITSVMMGVGPKSALAPYTLQFWGPAPDGDGYVLRPGSEYALPLLWNGVNEAGAYLFGHYSENLGIEDREETAARVLLSIEAHLDVTVKFGTDAILRLIFEPPTAWTHSWDESTYLLALGTAATSLDRRDYDMKETLRDLLERPEITLAGIKRLGRSDARRRLERSAELLDSWRGEAANEC